MDWLDVHTSPSLADDIGKPLEVVRQSLHVQDSDARLHVGMDAFIAIWQHSEKEQYKARLFSLPVIYPIACWVYNRFARFLYRWNRYKGHW